MEIRLLAPSDAAAFQALRLRGLQECPSAFSSSYEEESGIPATVVAERLAPRDGRAVFGAFEGEVLVGIVGLRRERSRKLAHKALIWGMYVAPSARGEGVGRQLLTRALAYAASEWRVAQVNLSVNAANAAALALYRRMGFEQFGLERSFMRLDGAAHDEVHMVCVLGGSPA